MYRCDRCNRVVGPSIPENRFPLKTREKAYERRVYIERGQSIVDSGGNGKETVSTIVLCPLCMCDSVDPMRNHEVITQLKETLFRSEKEVMPREVFEAQIEEKQLFLKKFERIMREVEKEKREAQHAHQDIL